MLKNKDFVPLHLHDEFSLLDGACKVKDVVDQAVKLGHRYVSQTNHGSMDGIIKFNNACYDKEKKEYKIKPIFGCELYLLEQWDKKDDPNIKHPNLHLTVQAKNLTGLKALLKGLGYANLNGVAKKGFASRAFLPLDYILKNKDWHGNVIIQTGCGSSPFWNAKDGGRLLEDYHDVFGEDLYAEIMPLHDYKHQYEINQCALTASRMLEIQPIVTNDSHYLTEHDHKVHDVVLAIGQRGMTWNNPNRWKFDSKLNYLRGAQEVYQSLKKMGLPKSVAKESILNTMEVAEKCWFKLEKFPVELPQVLPDGVDEEQYLVDTCAKELVRRKLDKNEYRKRLTDELNAILGGGFTRYMLLVADVIGWAKKNDILVGHGRGSVGGSLVAYLLRITEVDPIEFGLVFERFISEGRVDLPDIDIDFEDRKRHLIEKYLRERYGHWHVAHVSTFGMMRGKQTVRDVSRIFEVPRSEADTMSKTILVRPEMDSRASFSILDTVQVFEEAKKFYKKYPHVIKYSAKIEGQIKTVGIHAAGFVVSKNDLRESGNCHLINRKGTLTVNWDKEDLEQMGLMKLDVLGLSTLSVMSECNRLIKERHGKALDFYSMKYEDRETFEEIKKGNTVCAFQIGSKGLQKYCRDLKCDDFQTLVAASALWRPGCLKAGITQKFQECKLGQSKPEYINEIHKAITGPTYGQIIYQEQIMYLLYNMAGIPWKTTDQVRKVISKSEGDEKWMTYQKLFAEGCEKKGTMKYKKAAEMFEKLKFFGQYSFNYSHAVEYGILSYITMYLKVKYPLEFFCAYLNYGNVGGVDAASQEEKVDITIKEAERYGIKIKGPSINKSGIQWSI